MKSVALLPTHGDPFMLKHFLVNYERVWRGEVDELHVLVSGQPDLEACAYMREITEAAGAHYAGDVGPTMDHGVAMRMLAEHCGKPQHGVNAEIFLFIESDARVRRPGAVHERIERVASGQDEIIGSPRTSMDGRLHDACASVWGQMGAVTADGATGYGLWPCFLFGRMDALLGSTDHNFSSRGWLAGEEVAGLGVRCDADGWCADTFGSAALQLRARHRITPDVQYKGPWCWAEWLDAGHEVPWFHTGSLSSWGGSGGLTVDGDSELMYGARLTDGQELLEWGHRLHWWRRFLEHAGDDLPRLQVNYRRNLERMCGVMGVEQSHADVWKPVIDRLVIWDES
jgi:hypothetical protein